jgi:hypothetical protein
MRLGVALFWTRAKCGVEDWRAGERCKNERGRATGAREPDERAREGDGCVESEDGERRRIGKEGSRLSRDAEEESDATTLAPLLESNFSALSFFTYPT